MSTVPVPTNEHFWGLVKPLVLKSIIGAIVAAALVGVAAMIAGEFNTLSLQLFLIIIIIVAFSLLAWYDADVSSKRSHTFALVGVGVSIYLLFAGVGKVLLSVSPPSDSEYPEYYNATNDIMTHFSEWIWLVIIARFALLHAHLLLNIHRRYATPLLQVVAKLTIFLIVIFAVLLSLPSIFTGTFSEEYWRTTGAIFILDVLGTILIPISNALFGPKSKEPIVNYTDRPQYTQPHSSNPVQEPAQVSETLLPPVLPVPTQPVFEAPPVREKGNGAIIFEAPPENSRKLAWPRYENGTPLPVGIDGTPDFSAVERY